MFLSGLLGRGGTSEEPPAGDPVDGGASVVERIIDRLETAAMLSDRRDACRTLRALAKDYRVQVGAQGMSTLLRILDQDRSDLEILNLALETLAEVICEQDQLGEQFTEIFIKDHANVSLVLDLIEEHEFAVRWSAIKLLSGLVLHQTKQMQNVVLSSPMAISRLMDLLLDNREVIRNDALLMLTQLTRNNANIQKIVAFESAFDRLLDIVASEGFADGGIVAEDSLQIMLNLLHNNVSNLNYFKEGPYIARLVEFFNSLTQAAGDSDWSQTGKVANVHAMYRVVRCLVSPGNPVGITRSCQASLRKTGVLSGLCNVLMLSGVPAHVLWETINTIAEVIRGCPENQALFRAVQAPASPPTPAVLLLLMSMLNEKQPVELRCAILYCFQCYVHDNVDIQRDLIEQFDSASETKLIHQGLSSRDPLNCWLASMAISYIIAERKVLDHIVDEVATLLKSPNVANQARIGYLVVIITWLVGSETNVAKFVNTSDNVSYLTAELCLPENDSQPEAVVQSLCAIAMALCIVLNNDDCDGAGNAATGDSGGGSVDGRIGGGGFNRTALRMLVVNRVGRDAFLEKLALLAKQPCYTAAVRSPQIFAEQTLLDHAFCATFHRRLEATLHRCLDEKDVQQQQIDELKRLIRHQEHVIAELRAGSALHRDQHRLSVTAIAGSPATGGGIFLERPGLESTTVSFAEDNTYHAQAMTTTAYSTGSTASSLVHGTCHGASQNVAPRVQMVAPVVEKTYYEEYQQAKQRISTLEAELRKVNAQMEDLLILLVDNETQMKDYERQLRTLQAERQVVATTLPQHRLAAENVGSVAAAPNLHDLPSTSSAAPASSSVSATRTAGVSQLPLASSSNKLNQMMQHSTIGISENNYGNTNVAESIGGSAAVVPLERALTSLVVAPVVSAASSQTKHMTLGAQHGPGVSFQSQMSPNLQQQATQQESVYLQSPLQQLTAAQHASQQQEHLQVMTAVSTHHNQALSDTSNLAVASAGEVPRSHYKGSQSFVSSAPVCGVVSADVSAPLLTTAFSGSVCYGDVRGQQPVACVLSTPAEPLTAVTFAPELSFAPGSINNAGTLDNATEPSQTAAPTTADSIGSSTRLVTSQGPVESGQESTLFCPVKRDASLANAAGRAVSSSISFCVGVAAGNTEVPPNEVCASVDNDQLPPRPPSSAASSSAGELARANAAATATQLVGDVQSRDDGDQSHGVKVAASDVDVDDNGESNDGFEIIPTPPANGEQQHNSNHQQQHADPLLTDSSSSSNGFVAAGQTSEDGSFMNGLQLSQQAHLHHNAVYMSNGIPVVYPFHQEQQQQTPHSGEQSMQGQQIHVSQGGQLQAGQQHVPIQASLPQGSFLQTTANSGVVSSACSGATAVACTTATHTFSDQNLSVGAPMLSQQQRQQEQQATSQQPQQHSAFHVPSSLASHDHHNTLHQPPINYLHQYQQQVQLQLQQQSMGSVGSQQYASGSGGPVMAFNSAQQQALGRAFGNEQVPHPLPQLSQQHLQQQISSNVHHVPTQPVPPLLSGSVSLRQPVHVPLSVVQPSLIASASSVEQASLSLQSSASVPSIVNTASLGTQQSMVPLQRMSFEAGQRMPQQVSIAQPQHTMQPQRHSMPVGSVTGECLGPASASGSLLPPARQLFESSSQQIPSYSPFTATVVTANTSNLGSPGFLQSGDAQRLPSRSDVKSDISTL